jgi:hypothetical protein
MMGGVVLARDAGASQVEAATPLGAHVGGEGLALGEEAVEGVGVAWDVLPLDDPHAASRMTPATKKHVFTNTASHPGALSNRA